MKFFKKAAAVLVFLEVIPVTLWTQTVTISEIMADPAGADYYDEYIELYNISDSAVALSGWFLIINDYSDTLSFVADYGDTLPAHGFALIMDRGYLVEYKSSTYEDLIPDSALLITIQDNSFARSGLSNSAACQISLCNANGDTVSAVLTRTPMSGYSWEKIKIEGGNDSSNWGQSRNLRGTPGFRNSLAPCNYDVAVSNLKPVLAVDPDQVGIEFTIKNVGLQMAEGVRIFCGVDRNADRRIDAIFLDEIVTLQTGDSVVKRITLPDLRSGSHFILAGAQFAADELAENDLDSLNIDISFPPNCLIINEFMYYPAAEGGGEWIELFNISEDTINLNSWTFSDNATTVVLTDRDWYLPPQKYLVMVNDSMIFKGYWGNAVFLLDCQVTLPALNNTKDSIVIRDQCGTQIDALEFSSAWGYRQGTSLERKNPFSDANCSINWSLSTDIEKATPGRENSVILRDYDLAIDTVKIGQSDGLLRHGSPVTVQVFIRNNGIEPSQPFEIGFTITNPIYGQIADTNTVIANALVAGETQILTMTFPAITGGVHDLTAIIIWPADEKTDNNRVKIEVPVGYWPGMLVVNEVMFMPSSGQGEWFEIFNYSDITLDMHQWSFRDALGRQIALADSSVGINSGEYAIVAAHPDFRLDYPEFQGFLIVPESFPTLNNTSDSLFLYDAIGRLIDGVCYQEDWGGGTGFSLERRDPGQSALSFNNWSASQQTATPGLANSVLKRDNDLAIVSFTFTDTVETVGKITGFELKIVNQGRNPAGGFVVNLYSDRNGDGTSQADECCLSRPIAGFIETDSMLIVSGEIAAEKPGQNECLADLNWIADDDPTDNSASAVMIVAFPAGCLTINEFLSYPVSNQVEFVECVNVSDTILDLSGWSLGNRNSRTTLPSSSVPPFGYVLLCGDSTCFNFYTTSDATVIIPDRWLGLNNSADQICLKDLTGKTIDSLSYGSGWPVKSGFSTEKILPGLSSVSPESWNLAVIINGQTAGYLNSVTRPENDLGLDSLRLSAVTGDTTTVFNVCYYLSNRGQNRACGAGLQIAIADNFSTEVISTVLLDCVGPQAADSGSFQIGPLLSGRHDIIVKIIWPDDQVPENDSMIQSLRIAWPEGTLLLSEFMPYPSEIRTATSSVAEYLEIYNPGLAEIDLTEWQFSDQNTAMRQSIPGGFAIPPEGYFVFASDSSVLHFPKLTTDQTYITAKFPSLNNSEDALFLYDPTGRVADSLIYNPVWQIGQSISTERISFENANWAANWRKSVDPSGGTPGRKNSVAVSKALTKYGIKPILDVFSPDGDGIDDEIGIQYHLPFPSAKITVEIYDLTGRLISRPARNLETSAEGVIYWNGDSDFDVKARVGIYIVRCQANDPGSTKSVEYITTLVLAR